MSTIRILTDEVANRIAAGEVIERPASVVKELVENALDSGADRISVRIDDGGSRLIQVSDNGRGMDRDDALMCIEPHATSKIRESADIDCIRTLGFRGEALPSIASVSQFELQTRPADAVAGTQLLINGGTLEDVCECGCPPGTTVRVKRLFYNMPARRKFLRRKTTEESHVHETLLLHALGIPSVSFELHAEGRCLLRTTANADSEARAAMLLGREAAANLLRVDYQESGIAVRGLISRPGLTRSSRREQRLFVNGRPAGAAVLYSALRDTYGSLVVKGRYPPVLLHIEVPPDQVDVNVHPGKKEVRFRNPRQVGEIVSAAVRRSLQDAARMPGGIPRTAPLHAQDGKQPEAVPEPQAESAPPQAPAPPAPKTNPALPWPEQQRAHVPPSPAPSPEPHPQHRETPAVNPANSPATAEPAEPAAACGPVASDNPVLSLRILGTFADTYLVAEGDAGLVLIDQRAAHERILYERLLASRDRERKLRQSLLMPATVELSPAQSRILKQNLEQLDHLGFTIEQFGGNTFLVRAVPAQLPCEQLDEFLHDALQQLEDSGRTRKRVDETTLAQIASRSAVSTSRVLSDTEIDRLLADLARTEMPYTGPTGRPVMVNLPFVDIARRFGRDRSST